jgi:hypothetical protein
MDKKTPRDHKSYQHPKENGLKHPSAHEMDKSGQRQGGIDKHGFKEKNKHGEF